MNGILLIKKNIAGDFFSLTGNYFWGWVGLYAIVGIFKSYREQKRQGSTPFSFFSALKFCFPKKTFWGPSAWLDYKVLLLSHYLILAPPIGLAVVLGQERVTKLVAPLVAHCLSTLGTFRLPLSNGFWVDAVYTVLVLLAADLGWTIQHILCHRIPRLWEFHKMHHSANELNIFSSSRFHPLDVLTQAWFAGTCVGIFVGLSKFVLGYTPSLLLFMNVSVIAALFRIPGIYRHSHIWISYGRTLSHLISSPAMHQIHHSVDPKHYDKNFSVLFSFWDLCFGTLYIPKEKEALQFGIGKENSATASEHSFLRNLLHPFFSEKWLAGFYVRKENLRGAYLS